MKYEDSLSKIVSLLEKLEGVKVIWTDCTSNRMEIVLTIESHKSHFWLEYCAEGANVPFRCSSRFYPWDKEAIENPALALIYHFKLIRSSGYAEQFDNFNYLGAYLVWLMHRFDLIQTDEANSLLDFWNSVHVDQKRNLMDNL